MTHESWIFCLGFASGLIFVLMYDFLDGIFESDEDDEDKWF